MYRFWWLSFHSKSATSTFESVSTSTFPVIPNNACHISSYFISYRSFFLRKNAINCLPYVSDDMRWKKNIGTICMCMWWCEYRHSQYIGFLQTRSIYLTQNFYRHVKLFSRYFSSPHRNKVKYILRIIKQGGLLLTQRYIFYRFYFKIYRKQGRKSRLIS